MDSKVEHIKLSSLLLEMVPFAHLKTDKENNVRVDHRVQVPQLIVLVTFGRLVNAVQIACKPLNTKLLHPLLMEELHAVIKKEPQSNISAREDNARVVQLIV